VISSCLFSSSVTGVKSFYYAALTYKGYANLTQTSHKTLHYIVYAPISDKMSTTSSYCRLLSYKHQKTIYFAPLRCVFGAAKHYFRFPNIQLQGFNLHSSFPIYNLRTQFHLTLSKIRLSAYNNSYGNPTHNSSVIASITITNNEGLNTDPWYSPTFA